MRAMPLATRYVEKPWGLTVLPPPFEGRTEGRRIGEIWFPAPAGLDMPVLTKFLFTSDRLSIQVHPDDAWAHAHGIPSGKEECWYILDAEPGACLGIGTRRPLSAEELRAASLSGEIESLMEWHPVRPDMLFHITPGTVHAIGPGISLVEVQQNIDLTYRLYDYGRPRELHLDDGVAVSRARPFPQEQVSQVDPGKSAILLETAHFTLAHICDDDHGLLARAAGQITVVPLAGMAQIGDLRIGPGECAVTGPTDGIAVKGRALVSWNG